MPLYDIHGNGYVNQNYQLPANNGFDTDSVSEETFFPSSLNEVQAPYFPSPLPFEQPNNAGYFQPQTGSVPTFQTNGVTFNGGLPVASTFQQFTGFPHFQTQPPSLTTAPSLDSSSSTSLQYPLTPSPPLRKEVQKANPKKKSKGKQVTRNATQTAKQEFIAPETSKKRGPNKRPQGTAFAALLVG
jgi:hypothetical protein